MQARAHEVKLSIYLVDSNLQENALNMHCIKLCWKVNGNTDVCRWRIQVDKRK